MTTDTEAARHAIFARLGHAYEREGRGADSARDAVADRLDRRERGPVPARGDLHPQARVALFTEMAQAVMAEVKRLSALADVPAAVAGYLRQHNLPQRIALAPDPLLERCGWAGQPLLRVRRGTAAASDLAGVTAALAGVAETGTLVLASSPERPTLLAFLPETSVVVLPAALIDASYEDAWDRVRALPGGPPRSVNMVTGPSRTADIAQKLELGAHGPKRLLVLVVDDADAG